MKKIFGLAVAMMLGLTIVGCEETDDLSSTMEQTETKIEEEIKTEDIQEVEVEETEIEEEPEEIVENTVLTFEDEEFKHFMTTNLPEEEYDRYFNSFKKIDMDAGLIIQQEIEFDGSIDFVNLRDGYDTRYELGMTAGDYSETDINGPFIKVKDIAGTELKGLVFGKCNVKVKAKIDKYDMDNYWLVIDIIEIEAR